MTLLELTSAYGVFANQGFAMSPHLILRVDDADGRADLERSAVASAGGDVGDRVHDDAACSRT